MHNKWQVVLTSVHLMKIQTEIKQRNFIPKVFWTLEFQLAPPIK